MSTDVASPFYSVHRSVRLFAMVLSIALVPAVAGASPAERPPADRARSCSANLSHIYRMIKQYEHHSGTNRFPTLGDLAWTTRDMSIFVCGKVERVGGEGGKIFRTSYVVVNDPRTDRLATVSAHDIAIVVEKVAGQNGKKLVLFYDGTVSELNRDEFSTLERNGFVRAGQSDSGRK